MKKSKICVFITLIITEGLKTSERNPNKGNHPQLWQKRSLPQREFRHKRGNALPGTELLAVPDSRRAGGSQPCVLHSIPVLHWVGKLWEFCSLLSLQELAGDTPQPPGALQSHPRCSLGLFSAKTQQQRPQKPHQAVATLMLALMGEGDTGDTSSHLPGLLRAAPCAESPSWAATNFLPERNLVWGKVWFWLKL